jgi:hypothetical protein
VREELLKLIAEYETRIKTNKETLELLQTRVASENIDSVVTTRVAIATCVSMGATYALVVADLEKLLAEPEVPIGGPPMDLFGLPGSWKDDKEGK